ncbi:SurA N-terminal domain-containing protein [Chthonobacter rhizosphaerae]|uniref:SurA N-terminal domain-containing protein n=1 Tax=Chthonobacter rhizosphaerae TaxID=2735553 RepID=UPI0015EFD672|nr:SurA N-terminal domain-containing protein [Chthonobacter rhizosphaerae]
MRMPKTFLTSLFKGTAAAVLAVGLLTAGPAVAPVAAQSSIKVIVNDSAITTMDISSRAKLLQLANRLSPGAAQKAAVEELIDDTLRLSEAKRRGITIKDEQVNEAVAEIASRSKLTPAQFAQALGQSGISIKTLKERIRAQMAWGRIVRAKVQQNVRQEQTDLVAQMRRQEQSPDSVTAEDYVLQRVVFTLPAKRGDADVQRRRREAEALRSRFNGCEEGLAAAKSLKEVAVLNIGRRLASEVPPQMREQVKETKKGALTKPQVTDQGIEMLAVCDRITVTGESAMSASLDAEQMSAQAKTVSETLLRELRQKSNIVYR